MVACVGGYGVVACVGGGGAVACVGGGGAVACVGGGGAVACVGGYGVVACVGGYGVVACVGGGGAVACVGGVVILPINLVKNEFYASLYYAAQSNLTSYVDFAARNFVFTSVNRTTLFYLAISAVTWRIIPKHIHWVFAGVKTILTSLYLAFLFILFAYLKLEFTTSHVAVKALIGFYLVFCFHNFIVNSFQFIKDWNVLLKSAISQQIIDCAFCLVKSILFTHFRYAIAHIFLV